MKRILSVILCTLLIAVFAVTASAESINMAGGCKVEVEAFRADPADVIKDGIIGENEYVEVEVNRDPATTDLLYSWSLDSALFAKCEEFLNNVHFYFSWDEVHGLNVAVKATLLETPTNIGELPAPGTGDEGILFQFGMMCSVVKKDDMGSDVMYRGISKNTETGELLIGDYGVHGYKGNADIKPYEDFNVAIEGNTVTYEISYPIDAVLPVAEITADGLPVEDSVIHMNITATGGSTGIGFSDSATYAISLGDGGYMTTINLIENPSPVKVKFMSETIKAAPTVDDTTKVEDTTKVDDTTKVEDTTKVDDTTATPTQPATTEVVTSIATQEVVVTDDKGDAVTDEEGKEVTEIVTEVVTSIVTEAPTQSAGGNKAPVTADPMVIAAVVAAISACGVVVAKKRK